MKRLRSHYIAMEYQQAKSPDFFDIATLYDTRGTKLAVAKFAIFMVPRFGDPGYSRMHIEWLESHKKGMGTELVKRLDRKFKPSEISFVPTSWSGVFFARKLVRLAQQNKLPRVTWQYTGEPPEDKDEPWQSVGENGEWVYHWMQENTDTKEGLPNYPSYNQVFSVIGVHASYPNPLVFT